MFTAARTAGSDADPLPAYRTGRHESRAGSWLPGWIGRIVKGAVHPLFRPHDDIDDHDPRSWQQFDRWISVVKQSTESRRKRD